MAEKREKEFRIGQGSDTHRLIAGRKLMLGGVEIPYTKGADAHSDGDVLLHALTDSLLGALALGDIGQWFSNTDPRWAGKVSSYFVQEVVQRAHAEGWKIVNVDATVIAEEPRLQPHIVAMREKISALLGISVERCSIKANTAERMGALGRGEGIQASCIVLLSRE